MTIKIGELISQIRNQSKAVVQDDVYLNDRLIYSLIKKHFAIFAYREDSRMKLAPIRFLYSVLPMVELVEVNLVEACCPNIKSECTIKRTKEKLPPAIEGYSTPMLGNVTSIDGSAFLLMTTPSQFSNKANASDFRYNNTLYYWYLNGYLYFPNLTWNYVRIEIMLDGEALTDCGELDPCKQAQEILLTCPDYLLAPIQTEVLKDVAFMFQVPSDKVDDKQTI